jgi:hypothetical protein
MIDYFVIGQAAYRTIMRLPGGLLPGRFIQRIQAFSKVEVSFWSFLSSFKNNS